MVIITAVIIRKGMYFNAKKQNKTNYISLKNKVFENIVGEKYTPDVHLMNLSERSKSRDFLSRYEAHLERSARQTPGISHPFLMKVSILLVLHLKRITV